MKKLLIIPFIALLLCGCENRKCIKSHQENRTCLRSQVIIINGKTRVIMIPYQCEKTICDEYEESNEN